MSRKNNTFECINCDTEWNADKSKSKCHKCKSRGERIYFLREGENVSYRFTNICQGCNVEWHSMDPVCSFCGDIGAQTILMSESEKKCLKRTGKSFESIFPPLKQKKQQLKVKTVEYEFRMYECQNPDCLAIDSDSDDDEEEDDDDDDSDDEEDQDDYGDSNEEDYDDDDDDQDDYDYEGDEDDEYEGKEPHKWNDTRPKNNPKSRCKKCGTLAYPIKKEDEIGIGVFDCNKCNKKFHGFAEHGVKSRCYDCNTWYLPTKILARSAMKDRKSNRIHECEECIDLSSDEDCPVKEKFKRYGTSN